MFSRIFGNNKSKHESKAGFKTLHKLTETLAMLEKKERVLQRKASEEMEKAKEFTRTKNKKAAIQSLKRKKLFEHQIEQLGNFQLRIHDQMIMLEGAKATSQTVEALKTGAAEMRSIQRTLNVKNVDKTMEEINEQTENTRLMQEALGAPFGVASDIDEDELEAELEELESAGLEEELEERLIQPAKNGPTIRPRILTTGKPSSSATCKPFVKGNHQNDKNDGDDDGLEELVELQRAMAL
ncbi:unnamed protein product [Cuscuta campestris]|uniref:Uncharacterized protein n=1 Tax=Cuscuta campestris TaxID=132261 RepID=A0A484MH12_9ASTE|nr:unnamed protein product [Cuscuta campestris]